MAAVPPYLSCQAYRASQLSFCLLDVFPNAPNELQVRDHLPAIAGSPNDKRKCSRWATSTSCLLCRMNCPRSPCRTKRRSTVCCSRPARIPCWKSPPIPNISGPPSDSSAFCTPGAEPLASPPRALRCTGRRVLARPDPMDSLTAELSRAGSGTKDRIPGQSPRWAQTIVPRRETRLRRLHRGTLPLEPVPRLPGASMRERVGRLC
jgi:hypothetical protein